MKTSSFRVSRGWIQGSAGRRSYGRLLRRLHVESMEDRLMLSAAEPSFDWLDSSTQQVTFQLSDQTIVANRVDGGFITFRSANNFDQVVQFGDFDVSGSDVVGTSTAAQLLSTNALYELIHASSRGNADANLTLQSNSGEIRVIEFASALKPVFEPPVNTLEEASTEASPLTSLADSIAPMPLETAADNSGDGGSIPISTILASVGSLENLRASQGREQLSRAEAEGSNPVEQVADASDSSIEITAEWARAVAFEHAGGEPIGNGQGSDATAQDDTNATILLDNELSATGAEQLRAPDSDVEAPGIAPEAIPTASSTEQIVPLGLGQLPLELTGDAAGLTALSAMEMNLGGAVGADASFAQAFEELGDEERVRGHWLTDYARQSVHASPLLLMLALERIAARNSRRAGKTVQPTPQVAAR